METINLHMEEALADGATSTEKPDHNVEGVIVDLKNLIEPLTQYEDISTMLSTEQEQRLVSMVKTMSDMSYDKISRRYPHWQEADRAHDVYVPADTTDFREKAVIPDTRAISDTVLTYMMSALGGRNPMFQLEGLDRKSRKSAMLLERVLHQQMRRTAGEARVAQMLLDNIRYGMSPTKLTWNPETNTNNKRLDCLRERIVGSSSDDRLESKREREIESKRDRE